MGGLGRGGVVGGREGRHHRCDPCSLGVGGTWDLEGYSLRREWLCLGTGVQWWGSRVSVRVQVLALEWWLGQRALSAEEQQGGLCPPLPWVVPVGAPASSLPPASSPVQVLALEWWLGQRALSAEEQQGGLCPPLPWVVPVGAPASSLPPASSPAASTPRAPNDHLLARGEQEPGFSCTRPGPTAVCRRPQPPGPQMTTCWPGGSKSLGFPARVQGPLPCAEWPCSVACQWG